jgi:site-specific DNA recombinase
MRAAIYIRQSQTSERTISPALQEEHVRRFIKEQGWEVVGEPYSDIDISGMKEENRPAFLRLKKDYADGVFDVAVADDFSRFARNKEHAMALLGSMAIATYKEGAADPDDDFMPALHFLLADKFSKDMSKRWKDAHRKRLEQARPPQGHHHFGYVKTQDGYDLDPVNAPLLKECYAQYLKGVGFKNLAGYLTEHGAVTVRGAQFNKEMLLKVMDNPFSNGKIRYKGEESEGAHEAIITDAQWAAYKRKRQERATLAPRTKSSEWPFAGMVRCSRCGSSMVKNSNGKRIYLFCSKQRKGGGCEGVTALRPEVDWKISMWLGGQVDKWASEVHSGDAEQKAADELLAELEHSHRIASEKVDDLLRRAVLYGMSDSEVLPVLGELRQARDTAASLVEQQQAVIGAFIPASDVYERITRGSEGQTLDEWKEVIRRMIEKVVIHPDRKVEIIEK